ncbi:MAG: EamA family transporter [Candidatus Micrarchaeota archaeon]|nr:EamA family transporter [Candidatus Micrarchaeota archaeon]
MEWFLFALCAAASISIQKMLSRRVLKEKVDTTIFTILNDFIAGIALIPAIFVFEVTFPQHNITWLLFILSVVFYGLGDYYTFKALEGIAVSTWQILTQVRHIFVLAGGFILFSESLAPFKIVGIFLIIFGAFVTLFQKNKTRSRDILFKGAFFTFISSGLFALGFLTAKAVVSDFSPVIYASLNMIGVGLGGMLIMALKRQSVRVVREMRILGYSVLLPGIFLGLYDFFLFLSFKFGEVSRAVPVAQSSLIFTVIGGIIFLKERERLHLKIAGLFIISAGVAALYLV